MMRSNPKRLVQLLAVAWTAAIALVAAEAGA